MNRDLIGDDFALVPDNGPPRLIRYDLPSNDFGLVAVLTKENNLLRVNKGAYEALSALQQHRVLLARTEFTYVRDLQF